MSEQNCSLFAAGGGVALRAEGLWLAGLAYVRAARPVASYELACGDTSRKSIKVSICDRRYCNRSVQLSAEACFDLADVMAISCP